MSFSGTRHHLFCHKFTVFQFPNQIPAFPSVYSVAEWRRSTSPPISHLPTTAETDKVLFAHVEQERTQGVIQILLSWQQIAYLHCRLGGDRNRQLNLSVSMIARNKTPGTLKRCNREQWLWKFRLFYCMMIAISRYFKDLLYCIFKYWNHKGLWCCVNSRILV